MDANRHTRNSPPGNSQFGLLRARRFGPFFLFSATAGQIAEKYEKSRLIRAIKLLEIAIMSIAVIGLLARNIGLLLGVLFLMGAQSALFGPVKYSILPQHLREQEAMRWSRLPPSWRSCWGP